IAGFAMVLPAGTDDLVPKIEFGDASLVPVNRMTGARLPALTDDQLAKGLLRLLELDEARLPKGMEGRLHIEKRSDGSVLDIGRSGVPWIGDLYAGQLLLTEKLRANFDATAFVEGVVVSALERVMGPLLASLVPPGVHPSALRAEGKPLSDRWFWY